ncbi:DUF192 domain-containing protein [Zunongwangia sp. HGR-M22]|nr:DUF192 domain-containing protein [Zunongwangia sp. HGR-M22]WBL27368.1 DUF192 domain-containing protein [Zunongwangia sp. HGR-M22]
MKKFFNISIIGFAIIFTSCKNDEGKTVETEEIEFRKDAELYLIKTSGDTLKMLDIEIANDNYTRATGLMYRESLKENHGMLFVYPSAAPRSFYMKNTYIPLDLVFFNSDSTIVSFQKDAKPLDETSLPSQEPAQFILEINAGSSERWDLNKGDRFSVQQD